MEEGGELKELKSEKKTLQKMSCRRDGRMNSSRETERD